MTAAPPNTDQLAAPAAGEETATDTGLRSILRNRPLMTLTLGHLTVDMYVGILPLIYPLLTDKFDLSLKTVGLVSLAYSGVASLSQPIFGLVTDRVGPRYIGLALFWTGMMFCLLGYVPSFTVLLALAALAGLGSGAYHPMGAVSASAVIPDNQRNSAMSVYVTGGTLGVAMGPLIGAGLMAAFGLHGTLATFIPGAVIAIFLLVQMRTIAPAIRSRARVGMDNPPPIPWGPMSVIIGLMMMRSWTLFGIQSFIPTWYADMGYRAAFYGLLSTVILLASALGTVGVGALADRFGRKGLMIISSIATVPVVLLFAMFPGPPAFVSGALIGLLAASTGPLLLVMSQQLMVGRPGVASGLILGLGFVMGAVGVPVMGAVADRWGMQTAMMAWALIAGVAIVLSMLLPTEAEITELAARKTPAPAAESPA